MKRLLILCILVASASAGALWSPGLLGAWSLEDTALDGSGNGRHGTSYGTAYTTGKFGRCDTFNNNTHTYVSLGTGLDVNGEMTLSAWFNTASTDATSPDFIVCNSSISTANVDYSLGINKTSGRFFSLHGGAYIFQSSKTALSTNTWYHVALVRTGSAGDWTLTLYLNGAVDSTYTSATNPNGTNQVTAIGRFGASANWPFNGKIDEVFIWNRALSARDIQRVMMGMAPIE